MKILIIVITGITFCVNTHSQAQTIKEWSQQKKTQKEYLIQQIAVLQLYLGYVKKGYEIVHQGLALIGDIKKGKFNLDKTYVASLDAINPAISHSAKAEYIMALHQLIEKDIQQLYEMSRKDVNLTSDERGYLSMVCTNLLEESEGLRIDLKKMTSSNVLQMKDDQRLARIDKILDEIHNLYAFTESFGNSTKLLSLQRHRQQNDVAAMHHLHQLQP